MPANAVHPYDALTPDVVLDALSSVGLEGDGRLTTLNSYENRVYLAHLDHGDAVVLKFYRPQRWRHGRWRSVSRSTRNWPKPRCLWWRR